MRFGNDSAASVHMPGFAPVGAGPALNASPGLLSDVDELMSAFRREAGPDMEIMLDANFNFRAEGFIRIARILEGHNVRWLEVDVLDPATLATIRRSTRTPIGSLEAVFGRRALRPYLEQGAVDVAIIDVMWNGFTESLSMAALADAYETSVALHNYAGSLAATIGAHLAAIIPNLTTMEIEVDGAQQSDVLLTVPPRVERGFFQLPKGPGWGCEVNEAALARHAVTQ
jgi:galactonate dehydratase